ncbi:MAG: dihydrofolate reductase [Rhizobiaceae bacterium]
MSDPLPVAIVVAISENGVIGKDDWMPWRLSTDMKRFKALTMGNPVIMGRKTFESIGKPLPGRLNIVITRNSEWRAGGVATANSLQEAIELARGKAENAREICIAGGGQIYSEALPIADRMHVTHVLAEIDGDTHFPAIDPAIWRSVSSQEVATGEKDSHPTRYVVYERTNRTG